MNLKHLAYFKTVAEVEHITRAANQLNIAQPALSKTIRTLEESIGYPLFERKGRNIYLNENGQILYKYVQKIFQEQRLMEQELKTNRHREEKAVTILLKSTPLIVIQLITEFRRIYPDISVRLITYNRNTLLSDLQYDFWIDSSIYPPSQEGSILLLKEPLVLAFSRDSDCRPNEPIALADVSHRDFISLPLATSQGQEFLSICTQSGFSPNVVLQTTDYNTIQEMVANRLGIALVPKYSWGFHRNEALQLSPLLFPEEFNYISLNRNPGTEIRKAAASFIRFVTDLTTE